MLIATALAVALSAQPGHARDFTEQEKLDMAKQLSMALPALDVTYTGAPVIVGDVDPVVFKLAPSGKPGFGNLFLSGRYDIIHKPDSTSNLGSYLCHLGQEFARTRRAQNSSFLLPEFDVNISVGFENVGFEISGDEQTLAQIIYGILYLWDAATDADYGRFRILIRGSADEGGQFVGTKLAHHPIDTVVFLPSALPDPMLFYDPGPTQEAVPDPYANTDLPNLRATYVKEIIDAFLASCKVEPNLASTSSVINGSVFNGRNTDYRTVELFFYAYR